jgi:uncharacterized protein YneF (UPF0154 family)
MRVLKTVVAIIAGVVAGGFLTFAIEYTNTLWHPMPPGLDLSDSKGMAEFVEQLPVQALLIVVVAYAVGSFVGTWITRRIAPDRMVRPALVTGGLYLLATISNFFQIPHPLWMIVASLVVVVLGVACGIAAAGPRFYEVHSTRRIRAPLSRVFDTISQVDKFSKAVPNIESIEIMPGPSYGVGTKFRETRTIQGRKASSVLAVVELVNNERIRLDSDVMNTHWTTLFTVRDAEDGLVQLDMTTQATPKGIMAKLMMPMMVGMVRQCLDDDMDAVQSYAERQDT